MKKWLWLMIAGIILMIGGCVGINTDPNQGICAGVVDSEICRVTKGDPRAVETLLMAANFGAIKKDLYSTQQALKVVDDLERILGTNGITYEVLLLKAVARLEGGASVLFVLTPYMTELDKPIPISDFDLNLFRAHLQHQRVLIEALLK